MRARRIPRTAGEIVVGRPRVSAEDLATVTFKLLKSQVAALDETAKRADETRSQVLALARRRGSRARMTPRPIMQEAGKRVGRTCTRGALRPGPS